MTVRVYVPLTLTDLAAYDASGVIPESVDTFTAEAEDEESEYAALMAAADASAELLGGVGRRAVLVAEVPQVGGAIPMAKVVAVHVDVTDFTDPDDDLAWYASQEIPDLVAGL